MNITIQTFQRGSDLILTGSCCIDGGQCIESSINLSPIIDAIWSKIVERHSALHGGYSGGPDSIEAAGLGSLYRKAVKTARRVATSKVVKDLKKRVKEAAPYIKEAASLLPYGDRAVAVVEKLDELIASARSGDQNSVDKVRALVDAAKGGNPVAEKTVVVMRDLSAYRATNLRGPSRVEVSGFWYNHPYRSIISAAIPDPRDPGTVMRHMYYSGIK